MKARSKESDTEKWEFWQQHIKSQETSKLTRAKYCKLNKLGYHQFTYWLRRMRLKVITPSSLIPVKVNDAAASPFTLCTLNFKNGHTLNVHSVEVLSVILDRMVNNAVCF